jgi:hypothetical protein
MIIEEDEARKRLFTATRKRLSNDRYKNSHREILRERSNLYKQNNREKVRAQQRRWRKRNGGEKRRTYNLRYLYGVTSEWFDAKLQEQGGGCAICGATDKGRKIRSLHIDHNHTTKVNRGILCELCNHAIARIESVPDWDIKALLYLEQYKGECI